MTIFRKPLARRLGIAAIAAIALYAFFWWFGSGYVLSVVTTGEKWPSMGVRDLRLSHAMHRALETPPPAVHAGALAWHETEPGFEIAELPVLTDREEIDRFYLARIDPARFTFSVHVSDGRYHSIRDWERRSPMQPCWSMAASSACTTNRIRR